LNPDFDLNLMQNLQLERERQTEKEEEREGEGVRKRNLRREPPPLQYTQLGQEFHPGRLEEV
jgi:hypothetical protein